MSLDYEQFKIVFEINAEDAMADEDQLAAHTDSTSKKMQSSIEAASKKMEKDLETAAKRMRNHFDQLSFRAIMIGNALTYNVSLPLIGLATAATAAYVKLDSLNRGLTVVMGSSSAAAAEMQRLKEVAKLPGLGLKEAYQGSLNLQAVGMRADEARKTLIGFGNALGTVGKGKQELAAVQEQIMQMLSKGKIMTEDIRIIRSYVPQISQAMQKAFGTANVEELQKMGVTGKEFVSKIVDELNKLPPMTGGIRNELENVADSLEQSFSQIGQDIAPVVIELAKGTSAILRGFNDLPGPIRGVIEVGLGLTILVGPIAKIWGQLMQAKLGFMLWSEKLVEAEKTQKAAALAEEELASKKAEVAAATAEATKEEVLETAIMTKSAPTRKASADAVVAETAAKSANTKATATNTQAMGTATQLTIPYGENLALVSEQLNLFTAAEERAAVATKTTTAAITAANAALVAARSKTIVQPGFTMSESGLLVPAAAIEKQASALKDAALAAQAYEVRMTKALERTKEITSKSAWQTSLRFPKPPTESQMPARQLLLPFTSHISSTRTAAVATEEYADSLRKARTAITAEEIAMMKAAQTTTTAAKSTTVLTAATQKLVGGLGAVVKMILPLMALYAVIVTVGDIIRAFSGSADEAAASADKFGSSIDAAATKLKNYREQLDKEFPSAPLARGQGVKELLHEIKRRQGAFDSLGREATVLARAVKHNQELIDASPTLLKFIARSATGAKGQYQMERDLKALQESQDKALELLNTAKDKLKAAGYDLAGNKIRDDVQDQLQIFKDQIDGLTLASIRSAQLGDKAGEEWAKINANYYTQLASNLKQSRQDAEFNKATADLIASEEYKLKVQKYQLKQLADKREKAFTEVIAQLDSQSAMAKYYGNELEEARIEAIKDWQEAINKAYEIDTDTGRYKFSSTVIEEKLNAATINYWLAIREGIKKSEDKNKEESLKTIDAWEEWSQAIITGRKLEAEAAKDATGIATSEAQSVYNEGMARAYRAQVEGKPEAFIQQLISNTKRDSSNILSKADEEIGKESIRQIRSEKLAGLETERTNIEREVSRLGGKLETEVNPAVRMDIIQAMGKAKEVAATKEALAQLIDTQVELNELKAKGIDITERANLAQAKANKLTEDAALETKRMIDVEVKNQAESVRQKIESIREEDQARREAYEAEMERRRNMVQFVSGEDVWKQSILSGIKSMWGPVGSEAPIQDLQINEQETVRAIGKVQDEQQRTNMTLDQIKRTLATLGGSGSLSR